MLPTGVGFRVGDRECGAFIPSTEVPIMCLTCGCMDAHLAMGDNITYEDLKRIADGNGKSVDDTLETISRTAATDRHRHRHEYNDRSNAQEPAVSR